MTLVRKYLISSIVLLFVTNASAATYFFVDPGTIESGANWSGTDGDAYTTTDGYTGTGYDSLEDIYNSGAGVSGLGPGSVIFLRGGTYQEDYGDSYQAMPLPFVVDGTEADGWIKLASYPGEWAVLDANGSKQVVTGYYGFGETGGGVDAREPAYWIFERLEITGAYHSDPSDGMVAGLAANGGPFIVRYCYIHDNLAESWGENPAGIRGYFLDQSEIKYNWFYNNGWTGSSVISNASHVLIFSDYVFDRSSIDYTAARWGYEIAYNYMDTADVGVKDKAGQYLSSTVSDYTEADRYTEIHHNYFLNCNAESIMAETDFSQTHHNISIGAPIVMTQNRSADNNSVMANQCAWNNTIISGNLIHGIGYQADHPSIELRTVILANIITDWTMSSYQTDIAIAPRQCASGGAYCTGLSSQSEAIYTWTGTVVDKNLIYQSNNTDTFAPPHTSDNYSTDYQTTAEFNAAYSWSNYEVATAGLFTGVDSDRIVSTFTVDDGVMVADGGYGAAHPYLDGITLPDYIGAENPDDNDWIDGVKSLASTSVLAAFTTDDPTWIEGESGGSSGGGDSDGGDSGDGDDGDVLGDDGNLIVDTDSGGSGGCFIHNLF